MIDVLHHKLEQLYKSSLFDYKSSGGVVNIDEHESNAKVRRVDIDYRGQLLLIDNSLLRDCHQIYGENTVGHPELKHDCDGILFIKNRDKKYFILVELKSKYTEENITKAEKQLAASYVRVLSRLSCINGFNANEYKKCGVIVSYAPDVEELRRNDQKRMQHLNLNRFDKQMRAFSKDKGRYELDKRFVKLDNLPLRQEFIFEQLPVFHINVNKNDDSVRFEIDEILRKL